MSYISIASNVSVVNNAGMPIKKRERKKKKENIQSEDARSVRDRKPKLTVLIEWFAPHLNPIRCKTKTNRDSLEHVFPALCVS